MTRQTYAQKSMASFLWFGHESAPFLRCVPPWTSFHNAPRNCWAWCSTRSNPTSPATTIGIGTRNTTRLPPKSDTWPDNRKYECVMAGAKHSFSWFWSLRLGALDILALLLCGVISTGLHGYTIFLSHISLEGGLLVIVSCLICLDVIGGYEIHRDMGTLRYASEHVLAMCALLVIAFGATYGFS